MARRYFPLFGRSVDDQPVKPFLDESSPSFARRLHELSRSKNMVVTGTYGNVTVEVEPSMTEREVIQKFTSGSLSKRKENRAHWRREYPKSDPEDQNPEGE